MKPKLNERVQRTLIFLLIYILSSLYFNSTKYINEKREDDMRHFDYLISNSRDNATKAIINGHIQASDPLHLDMVFCL